MKSMTGYGKGEAVSGNRKVTVEIKAVNNRFLDINTRFPKSLSHVEDCVRKQIQAVVRRGTLDVYYTYEISGESDKAVGINMPLARQYLSALKSAAAELDVTNDITVTALAKLPDILSVTAAEEDREAMKELFSDAAADAVRALDRMRIAEGRTVQADLAKLVTNILSALKKVIARAPLVVAEYKNKLSARIAELLGAPAADEARIATEVAVFADKCDINEEISEKTGLPVGCNICVGAHDQNCNTFGCGGVDDGTAVMVIGTFGSCFVVSDKPIRDPNKKLIVKGNHGVGNWTIEAFSNAAASSFRWYRDTFGDIPVCFLK